MNARPGHAGPVVWLGVIAATCVLLVVFRATLWLVVPFLLALVIYYGLRPLTGRLVLSGLSVEAAANAVSGAFILAVAVLIAFLFPRLTAHAVQWQDSVNRYLDAGASLVEQTVVSLESRYAVLQKAQVSSALRAQFEGLSEDFAQRHAGEFVMGAFTWLPSLLLAPFLAFFFLRDGRRFKRFLGRAVPNAYFERTLYLLHEVDRTAHAYFQGLLKLTVLDATALALGLAALGMSAPLALGLLTAVLAWVPYVGSILGCAVVTLVAASDFPQDPSVAFGTVALFILVRLLDDFFFMPMTIGRSLRIHPMLSVVMLFVGGALAGVSGLMLVLPVLGVVMVIGETIGRVLTDPRLRARHAYAKRLRARQAALDLGG
ncbi:MAG: AI-2E family transporter [Rhodocyclaceae bacterium]